MTTTTDDGIADATVEAACRAWCAAEGIDPDLPCPGVGRLVPAGEEWPAWRVRAGRMRAALAAAEAAAWRPMGEPVPFGEPLLFDLGDGRIIPRPSTAAGRLPRSARGWRRYPFPPAAGEADDA